MGLGVSESLFLCGALALEVRVPSNQEETLKPSQKYSEI